MRSLFLIIFLVAVITPDVFIASARAESADEKPRNKHAEKAIAVLKSLNLDHPYLTDTAEYIGSNSRDGFIYLTDEEIIEGSGIKMQIRYDTGGFRTRNLQLNFTEEGSNYNLTGSSEGVMLKYNLKF